MGADEVGQRLCRSEIELLVEGRQIAPDAGSRLRQRSITGAKNLRHGIQQSLFPVVISLLPGP